MANNYFIDSIFLNGTSHPIKSATESGGGLDKTSIELLETILRACMYNSDQSLTITQLIDHLLENLPPSDEIAKNGNILKITNLLTAPTADGDMLVIS